MSEPNKFRFTVIIRDVITEVLKNAPDGWLKTNITYKTDSTYNGLRRTLSAPYTFVKKAAMLLRREWYTYSILGRAILEIEKLIPSTYQYETIYTGKINFSTGEDVQTGWQADTSTNDFTVKIDAYDTKKFLLPLTGPDVIDITLPSLALKESADFIFFPSNDYRSDAFFDLRVINYQQNATVASVHDVGFLANSNPQWATEDSWFLKPTKSTKARVYGNMDIILLAQFVSSKNMQINFYRSDGTQVKRIFDAAAGGSPTAYHVDFDFIVDVPLGQKIFIYFENASDNNTNVGFQMVKGQMSVEYDTVSPPSKCKGIRAYDVYQRLLQAMNIQAFGANPAVPNQSYLLNKALGGVFADLAYTCSDSIRAGNTTNTYVGTLYQEGDNLTAGGSYLVLGGDVLYNNKLYHATEQFDFVLGQDTFTTPDDNGFVKQVSFTPNIIMSFKDDFFKDIFGLQGGQAVFGIENGKAYLEDWSYAFRPGSANLNIGIVDTKTKITQATDLLYNSIKGGYKDQQYDKINGQLEVNSEVRYVTDVVDPSKELDIQCSSRADPYGIEIARVVGVDTAASRSDNDNFMIYLKSEAEEDGSYMPVQMGALNLFSGVVPSYYNWFITPKQNLLRGGRYLRSIFDKMDGYSIRVSAPAKNVSLTTTDQNGRVVSESADVLISAALGNKLFIPWYAQVNARLPINASDLIDLNMFSDIVFTWNGVVMKGFPREISVDEGENSAQSFKLLLTPENNTLDLVR